MVFDDAVARSKTLQPLGYYAQPDAIAWGSSATSLIVSRSSSQQPLSVALASVTVSTSGLSVAGSVALSPAIYAFGRVFYGAGRAYDVLGHVIDVTSGAPLGQFTLPTTDPTVALLLQMICSVADTSGLR